MWLWTREFQACAVDKETHVKQTKEWGPSEKLSIQPVLQIHCLQVYVCLYRARSPSPIKHMTSPWHSLWQFSNSHLADLSVPYLIPGTFLLQCLPNPFFFFFGLFLWPGADVGQLIGNLTWQPICSGLCLSLLEKRASATELTALVRRCEHTRLSQSVLNSDAIRRHR